VGRSIVLMSGVPPFTLTACTARQSIPPDQAASKQRRVQGCYTNSIASVRASVASISCKPSSIVQIISGIFVLTFGVFVARPASPAVVFGPNHRVCVILEAKLSGLRPLVLTAGRSKTGIGSSFEIARKPLETNRIHV
jgi:hypothetical protein